MKKENIRKYPKSINNKQCVSQCYKAHTSVFHPTRFIYIREDYPFCATAVYEEKNPITGKIIERNTDRCLNPTVDADVLSEQMLLVPESEFTRESFLAMYYNIRTFDDIEKWLVRIQMCHLVLKYVM